MRVLVFANTPAHVHTYRHTVDRLIERGHDVHVLAREYACTEPLLEFFELPYTIYGSHGTDAYHHHDFARELGSQLMTIARESAQFRPDVVFGRGPYAAFAGTLTRAPVVLVLDDEPGDFNHRVSKPFADTILSPATTRRDFGAHHYTFDGFKECAYLHPDVFEPRGDIREFLCVDAEEPYVLLRFNALDALHDVGRTGFTPPQRRELIERLSERATVFVSDEGGSMDLTGLPARPYRLHPALIHDALAEADLLVADTGTMATEAGLLGTPAIRYTAADHHTFGEFEALAEADLVEQYATFDHLTERSLEVLADPNAKTRQQRRRNAFAEGLTNLTALLVAVAESEGRIEGVMDGNSDAADDRNRDADIGADTRVRPRSFSGLEHQSTARSD